MFFLIQFKLCLEARIVLDQPGGGQTKHVVSKVRLLEINLQEAVIGNRHHCAVLRTLNRLRAFIGGCNKPKLTNDTSRKYFYANFGNSEFSLGHEQHLGRKLVLPEYHLSFFVSPSAHV